MFFHLAYSPSDLSVKTLLSVGCVLGTEFVYLWNIRMCKTEALFSDKLTVESHFRQTRDLRPNVTCHK